MSQKHFIMEQIGEKFGTQVNVPGTLVTIIWCIFDLVMFKVILRSFSELVSKWLVTRKGSGYRSKQAEICDSETRLTHIQGTFDLVVFKGIFSFALCYCTAELITVMTWVSSVCRHHFLGNSQVDWHQILMTGTYPLYLDPDHFSLVFRTFFYFFTISFHFRQRLIIS